MPQLQLTLPCALAFGVALAACGESGTSTTTVASASDAIPPAAAATVGAPAEAIAGTGARTTVAEPATDEVPTTPGSDAEDAQYFDFTGEALATVRANARAATPPLRDAARRLVDATAEKDGCGTYPEGERLFLLDLDGRPGDEALLLYTLEGCNDMQNYYDRNGYVLRESDGAWNQVAEFSLGTRLVGPARISSLTGGRLVVTPDADSQAQAAEISLAP